MKRLFTAQELELGGMQEVDRTGKTVQTFTNGTFGYADFRTSLYGPPPR